MNVYDFDNTIYDGESALDFFLCYVRENPEMLLYIPKVMRAMLRYKRGKVTIEQFMDDYAPLIQKYYCQYDRWDAFTKEFWDDHMDRIKPFYESVRKPDDVILTASPTLTVREIASRLGIRNYVCSVINQETGRVEKLCMRQNKVKYFFETYGEDAKIDDFYTDSVENDSFIALRARRVFLVKGPRIERIK